MYAYDVDGDGRNDVITSLAAHGYGLTWFQNVPAADEGIAFQEFTFMNKEPSENRYGVKFSQLHAIDLKDMDGDGLKDPDHRQAVWAHGPTGDPEPGAPPVLYWFRLVRQADRTVDWVPYLIDADSGVGTQVMATDVNGDRLPDVVVGNKRACSSLSRKSAKWAAVSGSRRSPSRLPPSAEGRAESTHSWRRAAMGRICTARQAGRRLASNATGRQEGRHDGENGRVIG
jgi:hypothetical protein